MLSLLPNSSSDCCSSAVGKATVRLEATNQYTRRAKRRPPTDAIATIDPTFSEGATVVVGAGATVVGGAGVGAVVGAGVGAGVGATVVVGAGAAVVVGAGVGATVVVGAGVGATVVVGAGVGATVVVGAGVGATVVVGAGATALQVVENLLDGCRVQIKYRVVPDGADRPVTFFTVPGFSKP